MSNRLAAEKSPYLRQHAENPVEWYPWSEEALAKAKREMKPILLSCGYSSCHWCHVMAHESFEDPNIAELMNKFFVNIKVDREERPEIDKVYQEACHLLTRQGGWPLTVFLTPDAKPFYAGTYFPPQQSRGYQGFGELVQQLGKGYQDHPGEFEKLADELTEAVADSFAVRSPGRNVDLTKRFPAVIRAARENIFRNFDQEHGGMLGAPKFPSVPNLELLWASPEENHKRAVVFSLEKMIAGGIFDQLGGGFHRYSTDARWLIPHFEKMLYDNALLLSLMARVCQATGNKTISEAAHQTAEFVLRELTGPDGQFFASLDADVAGREGSYYVWTPSEIAAVLSSAQVARFNSYFGISDTGNFEEGTSVLYRTQSGPLPEPLHPMVQSVLAARQQRQYPFRDEKAIAGWNGLQVRALAEAAAAFDNNRYLQAAERGMRFIWDRMRDLDGSLWRSYLGGESAVQGVMEDYAYCIAGLLALHEVTKDETYLDDAVSLQGIQVAKFYDASEGGFFMTERSMGLPVMTKDSVDEAVPSGTGQSIINLARLEQLKEGSRFSDKVEVTIELYFNEAAENPWGYATFLRGAEMYLSGLTTGN